MSTRHPTRYACAAAVAMVAAAFCAVLTILMLTTFIRASRIDPLDTPALQTLKRQVQANPQNESLQEQVRALDLLARRAHFNTLTALRVGGLLLLAGIAVFLMALHAIHTLTAAVSPPSPAVTDDAATTLSRSRLALTLTSVLLIALTAGIATYLSKDTALPAAPDDTSAPPPAWPNFRGQSGIGIAKDVNPPLDWDGETGRNIIWRQEIPRSGFSSPIVDGDQIYLSGGDASVREVYAFSTTDGRLLWRHPATGIQGSPTDPTEVAADTGYAAATMATDGKRCYAIFASGNILALTPEGNRVWAKNYGIPDNPYGHASSLLVHEGHLFVQFDDNNSGRLMALRTDSGALAWSTSRDVLPCWSSPILIERDGNPEIIINGNTIAAGYDPATGAETWQFDCMGGEVAVSPAWWNGTVYVANEYAKLAAIRLGTEPQLLWEQFDDLPDVSSPVADANRLYMANSAGGIACLNATDGKQVWLHEYNEGFYSSPILANNRIYVTDKHGVTRIVAAGDTFTELASPALGEPATATPAFVDNRIYMRGKKHLFCIGTP